MREKIRIGISTCLLGESVRYNGGHKLDRFIVNTLGKYMEFVPVCPEVERGLSVPREAMRLVGDPDNPRLMTHSPAIARELGKLVGAVKKKSIGEAYDAYEKDLVKALALTATVKKQTNVLMHMVGYFKKQLSSDEKEELVECIERYRQELIPLVVPLTLISHYVRKYREPYLSRQVYLNPHPVELKLRNHS